MAGMERGRGAAATSSGNIDLADLRAKADAHGQSPGRDHDHVSLHPRRVRAGGARRSATSFTRSGGQVYLDGANLNAQVGLGPPGRLSAPTSATSICTRHSAFPTAAAVPAWARSASRLISRRSCRGIPEQAGAPTADRSGLRGAIRIGVDPAHLLDLLSADGRQGPDRGDQGRHPQRELRCHAAGGALSAALQGTLRPRRARSASSISGRSRPTGGVTRRRRRQAPHRLRVSRADDELPGRGNVDDRADWNPSREQEIDRFCDAMIAIREEIQAIEDGRMSREDNPSRMRRTRRSTWRRTTGAGRIHGGRPAFPPRSRPISKYWPARVRLRSTISTGTATWSARVRRWARYATAAE